MNAKSGHVRYGRIIWHFLNLLLVRERRESLKQVSEILNSYNSILFISILSSPFRTSRWYNLSAIAFKIL